jgi:hypothetical protein
MAQANKDAAREQQSNPSEAQKQATRSHPLSQVPQGYTLVQDTEGNQVLVRLGMDGENPVSPNNPELKAVVGGQAARDESDKPSAEHTLQYPASEREVQAEREKAVDK